MLIFFVKHQKQLQYSYYLVAVVVVAVSVVVLACVHACVLNSANIVNNFINESTSLSILNAFLIPTCI